MSQLLSELVELRNKIDTYDVFKMHHSVRQELDQLIYILLNQSGPEFKTQSDIFLQKVNELDRAFESLNDTLNNLKAHTANLVNEKQNLYLQNSLHWFQKEMPTETAEITLSKTLEITPEDRALLLGRISRYVDWRIPGLVIGPKREDYINSFVALDPLYIIDTHQDLLEPAVAKFPPQYQIRLRQYVVKEDLQSSLLDPLPTGEQFGLVFAYNYFNFRPIEVIEQYLRELFAKIRPGGSFFMTFNDCDYSHLVALRERHWACYTPGSMIVKIAERIGFVVNHRHKGQLDVAWIEFGKPGVLKSIRGGQTLAMVVAESK